MLDTRSKGGHCQLTVPVSWSVEGTTGYSPGRKISASVNSSLFSNLTFAGARGTATMNYRPVRVLQDDDNRLLYTFDPGSKGAGKSGWFEVISSSPPCAASLMFAPGTDEAPLRKIAASLTWVKQ